MKFQKAVTGFLLSICFICGIIMLFFGIKETAELRLATKGYIETEGYLTDYEIYSNDENGITYKLIYTYTAGGNEYTVATDNGTKMVPPEHTAHKIMYNPDNPAQAEIAGENGSTMLIFGGAMFTAVPAVMFLGILVITGRLDTSRFDFLGLIIGIVLILVSFITVYIISGSFSLVRTFEHVGFWTAVPSMLIAAGAFVIIKTLFSGLKKRRN